MPRNPHKTRCQTPNCRSWAMRGRTHCHSHSRSHSDLELSPRGAGAPQGNLNALKDGQHAHPLPRPDLRVLARQIAQEPDDLPLHIGRALQSLPSQARDPLKALRALNLIISELIPLVAGNLFAAELESFLQHFPPSRRPHHRAAIWRETLYGDFENSLTALRDLKKKKNNFHVPGNQLPEQ